MLIWLFCYVFIKTISIEVLEENKYYPFGTKHEGYNALAGNPAYKYGYNGKELQTESGMHDYGSRFYMPDIGRWGVIDAMSEKYRRWSPYTMQSIILSDLLTRMAMIHCMVKKHKRLSHE
ncbi:RHS repeat-associated core domain-containing protein [uncultured Chryseobacterium sp.]|uniref:RHS repeat domain-containing protein n=1 Tax=uncultured Chryseobacterium sp. TaxID=259322 RepID=UPI0025D9153E|nr:RHS repeat-associated core domain-containing protein [uncultured Chryseobacterium sp.]